MYNGMMMEHKDLFFRSLFLFEAGLTENKRIFIVSIRGNVSIGFHFFDWTGILSVEWNLNL